MTSPEDTFNALRRISYEQVCHEYMMAFIHHHSAIPEDMANEVLKKFNWTYAEMIAESRKREEAAGFEVRY